MARIIDLDEVLPADVVVRIEGAEYPLPADVPVPDYLAIARLIDELESAEAQEQSPVDRLEELYERVLDLFRLKTPDLKELPLGPRRLGELVLQIYGEEPDEPAANGAERPTRPAAPAGTRSTKSRPRPRRSASSK